MNAIELLRPTRKNILNLTKDLSHDQLNHIPNGFNNNIAWNLGHVLVTQQLLTYGLSNEAMQVPTEYVSKYRKGTKPLGAVDPEEIADIRKKLQSTIGVLEMDLKNSVFQTYKPYETSYGVYITTIEEAVQFNNLHEAMHLGTLLALMKFL